MVILSTPLIVIDLSDPKAVAKLLDEHTTDFVEVLGFLDSIAKAQGFELDEQAVSDSLRDDFGY